MIKILFVCHGNICRSPMAELVLKHMIRTEGLTGITVNSVAVSREEEGKPVYPPARRELERHGIAVEHRRARRITQQDVDSYDRIYYMDSRNARYLEQLFPGEEKFQKFLPRDVADPWYSGDFTQTWEDIWEGCGKILEELR